MNPLYQHLRYPERAESLSGYERYQVSFDHWQPIVSPFSAAFQGVFVRGAASILLIAGAQGSGKTLFARRIETDFNATRQGDFSPKPSTNLWHKLAGTQTSDAAHLQAVTTNTRVLRPEIEEGWLERLRSQIKTDAHTNCTVVLLDDVHAEEFLCEWAKLTYKGRTEDELRGLVEAAAFKIVKECRGDFHRCLFVFLSNRTDVLDDMYSALEKSHNGLASPHSLPIPGPSEKERIVRRNTNILNEVSYWACLDKAGPSEKEQVFREYSQPTGFTKAFRALNDAYANSWSAPGRVGRPSHKNLLSLVLLGTLPSDGETFFKGLGLSSEELRLGAHAATLLFRDTWASALVSPEDRELCRQARLIESEFALRVVTLDSAAVFSLCNPDQMPQGTPNYAAEIIRTSPLTYGSADPYGTQFEVLDTVLEALLADNNAQSAVEDFRKQFERLGQHRNTLYEPLLSKVFNGYNKALEQFSTLRPDVTLEQYQPCAVTAAKAEDSESINRAIRRRAHTVEFTSFVSQGLKGLNGYIATKISAYAQMLASV